MPVDKKPGLPRTRDRRRHTFNIAFQSLNELGTKTQIFCTSFCTLQQWLLRNLAASDVATLRALQPNFMGQPNMSWATAFEWRRNEV